MANQTNFGASIVPNQTPTKQPLLDSPALTPAVSQDDSPLRPPPKLAIPIHSPFYEHPPASHEALPLRPHSRQASADYFHGHEKDLESSLPTPLTATSSRSHDPNKNPFTSKISVDCNANKECTMWPSRQTLMQNRRAEKHAKRAKGGCAPLAPLRSRWGKLNRKQRLWVKAAIALFLIGVAVAIGVGISVAVHGGVYASDGGTHEIPSS